MEINTLGELLKYYREKYDFSQKSICNGICSISTLSRIEGGKKVVDSLVAETLLGRIGKEVIQFELILNDEDYQLWNIREKIKKYMKEEKYLKVKQLIDEYQLIMPRDESVHEQFVLFFQAKIKIAEKASYEEINGLLYRSLKLTKPEIDNRNQENFIYHPLEIELIVLLMHYQYEGWKQKDKEKNLLYMFLYIKKIYSGRQKEESGIMILMELVEISQKMENDLQIIKYVDEAIEFITQGRGIDNIAKLHFIKAQAIENLYHKSEKWQESEKSCKEECLMAYYVFDITGQKQESKTVKKFCEEKLKWQIIE